MILFGKLTLLLFNLALNNIIIVISLIFIVFSLRNRLKKVTINESKHCKTSRSNIKEIASDITPKYDAEIIIIGSGILGSVMAASLGKFGYRIVVIERDFREPSRIVGELMQPGGVEALKTLGLGDALEEIDAQSSFGYKIHYNDIDSTIVLPYGSHAPATAEARNPTEGSAITGKAFHHGRLVQNLRRASDPYANVHKIEGDAVKLIKNGAVVVGVEYKDGEVQKTKSIYAPLTIVADGCFSKFRKHLLPLGIQPQVKSYFVGVLIKNLEVVPQATEECSYEIRPGTQNQERYYAEVILADPSVILIYKISSFHTRILIDVPCPMPNNLRNYLETVIAPQLPERYRVNFEEALSEAFERSNRPQEPSAAAKFKVMPNSYLCTSQPDTPGVLTLGDAFNMRHPLTGGGMTVALNDAIFWTQELDCILSKTTDLDPSKVEGRVALADARKRFTRSRSFGYSFAVNVLAQALYALFASGRDKYLHALREACFHYFQMGGICISGPMGIISITNAKPHILIGHFFAVAFYAIYRSTFGYHWLNLLAAVPFSLGLLARACQIITPLVWNEIKSTAPWWR